MNKLKVIDLFSGIGGFSLGLHSTDIFETIKFVEFDKFCQKVLHKNFPNIPIEGDIRNVKGEEFEADVITGGFPCQPFSVAGRQKGTDDNRYLWPEMFRLIKEVKPEFVIGENVQGLINLQDGMVLRQVQDELEGEGFEVQCFLIPASGIGAWHRRNRVWIVGHSKHNGLLAAEKRSRDKKINGRDIRKGRTKPSNLREQVDPETMKMYPTPNARDWKDTMNTVPPSVGKTRGHSLGQKIAADQIKMYPTPRASGEENPETLIKRKGYKKAAQHNLTAAVKMYPTPSVVCEEGGEQSDRVEQTKSGGFILRKKNKPTSTFGAKLSDAMLYLEKNQIPTPTAHDSKNVTFPISQKGKSTVVGNMLKNKVPKPGGKLNPHFVEFLMGFPINWTKIDQAE